MAARAYAPDQILVTVNGQPVTNKSDDEFLTITMNEEDSVLKMGVDGEGAVSITKNQSGRFSIKVMSTSESNDILMAAYIAWKTTKIPAPIFVKDLNGRFTCTAQMAWPVKIPDMSFAREVGEVEWIFESNEIDTFMGGASFLVPST